MSWDVMVLNYAGKPPLDGDLRADDAQPLGPADTVRAAITRHLPGVDWSNPTWGLYEDQGFSIEFNTGDKTPIDSIMLHVRGNGDPLPALVAFANPNGWSLFDCTTGEFLDAMNPSSRGWHEFRDFRDRVAQSFVPEFDDSRPKRRWWNRTLHWGTNALGLTVVFLLFGSFVLVLGGAKGPAEHAMQAGAGIVVLGLDILYRRTVLRMPFPRMFLEYEEAGRLVFFPLWIWGIAWFVVGLFRLIA
jgi:hypothetical protein